jgi:hypothetical protein|tara:strand:- start:70 stop:399 length:330 start_codon:yes stop_codon:yes gene_type:complete
MLYTIFLFVIANIIIWYQLNSQLVWEWAKGAKSMWIMSLLGIPISLLLWYCTKIGYIGFGNLWAVRFMGFATSMLVFPIMTYFYLGEPMTLKVIATLILAIIIMLLQLL